MKEQRFSFDDIKAALLAPATLERLVHELAPGGRKAQGYWISRNPARGDRNPGSFWVRLKNPAAGAWRDEATGDKGDVIELVRYCLGHGERKETFHWCLSWLGWSSHEVDRAAIARQREKAAREAARSEERAQRDLQGNRGRARALFLSAQEELRGTPAHAYLQGRGIDPDQLRRPLRAVRFLPDHEHIDAEGEVRKFPCIISAMSGPGMAIGAVHRIWISETADGWNKISAAGINPPRKIWPSFKGLAIRVSRGAGNLTPEEATKRGRRGPLVLTEGVEDALAVALACPDHRVWAAGSLGNFGEIALPPCVSAVTVCADNDWHNKQAVTQLDRSIAALRRQGRPVSIARSWMGKDANDLLKAIS